MESSSSARRIWERLSNIDVSEQIETKEINGVRLSYLSWAWAWGILMAEFPDSEYEFFEDKFFDECDVREKEGRNWVVNHGKTCMVGCRITVRFGDKGDKAAPEPVSREMWLPVMNNKNNSLVDPDARNISDARMRCLVKCLAMFGLGHYIYAGEDVPRSAGSDTDTPDSSNKRSEKSKSVVLTLSTLADLCETVPELDKIWLDNKDEISNLKSNDRKSFDELVSVFKSVKSKINHRNGEQK